jgi:hypothetical protein
MQDCVNQLLNAINEYDPANIESVNRLRDLVCICSDNTQLKQDPFVASLLYTASQKMRVFGYNMLNHFRENPSTSSGIIDDICDDAIKGLYRSKVNANNILDRTQKEVIDMFQNISPRRLLVSAPTSYGKTFLMREIVFLNRERYKTILLVFPTVALLQENARSMNRFVQENNLSYNIVKNVDMELDLDQSNIFVFTPERVLQLIATYPDIKIDFFFFDEIYKIDEDYCSDSIDEKHDEIQPNESEDFLNANRGKTFRIALYLLSKMVPEYYLAGPNLNKDKFGLGMRRYLELNHISVKEISFEPTLRITVEAHSSKIVEQAPCCLPRSTTALAKLDPRVNDKIRGVVNYIDEQKYGKTLLYCTTPGKAIEYASKLAEAHVDDEQYKYSPDFEEFIEHIRHEYNIDGSVDEWSLIKVLRKGFGMHHGKLPKYIQQEILDQFDKGAFDILFCTSTIVEGVNTDAQNMIILNSSKGREKLTPFDIKNIKGRAGRYYHCFIGRVFYMHKELLEMENSDDIALNFATYSNAELGAIDIDNADIDDLTENNRQLKRFRDEQARGYLLPYEVFIKNRMVKKEDQEKLLQTIIQPSEFSRFTMLINRPVNVQDFLTYNWLKKILECFNRAGLIDDYTVKKYNAVGLGYREEGFLGILRYELKRHQSKDNAYSNAFKTMKDIVEHKIPKLLSLFESIMVYAGFIKGYDMDTFSLSKVKRYYETGVKSSFGEQLVEYGYPIDAIRRIEKEHPYLLHFDFEDSLEYCKSHLPKLCEGLDNYEEKLLKKFISNYK